MVAETMQVTELQAATVSTRQNRVRNAIGSRMNVIDSFVAGSYRRNTLVAPLQECDVDICIVLHPEHYNSGRPGALLDNVRAALLETYPQTPRISRNGQAVTISFTDFRVDVVPAFNGKVVVTSSGLQDAR